MSHQTYYNFSRRFVHGLHTFLTYPISGMLYINTSVILNYIYVAVSQYASTQSLLESVERQRYALAIPQRSNCHFSMEGQKRQAISCHRKYAGFWKSVLAVAWSEQNPSRAHLESFRSNHIIFSARVLTRMMAIALIASSIKIVTKISPVSGTTHKTL